MAGQRQKLETRAGNLLRQSPSPTLVGVLLASHWFSGKMAHPLIASAPPGNVRLRICGYAAA